MSFVYICHSVTSTGRESTPAIVAASTNENLSAQEGCKKMLQDLRTRFGDPKPLVSDDDLSDPNVFNNHQMLAAFECYKNSDRSHAGSLKLTWVDRYRRIDAIYEKLRSDDSNNQTFYYMTKQKLSTIVPK
jgi:hypothetical protein